MINQKEHPLTTLLFEKSDFSRNSVDTIVSQYCKDNDIGQKDLAIKYIDLILEQHKLFAKQVKDCI